MNDILRQVQGLAGEVGTLHSVISILQGTVGDLQNKIDSLQTENTLLKESQDAGFRLQTTTAAELLKALTTGNTVRQATYSQVAMKGAAMGKANTPGADMLRRTTSPNGARPTGQPRDGRAVTINIGRTTIRKDDYNGIRDQLQGGLGAYKATEGMKITGLRPGPADRIDVVFSSEEQAEKAKTHTQWLTSSIKDARIQPAQWTPVKLDGVPKSTVLQGGTGSNIQKSFAEVFKQANSNEGMDATVLQPRWLSFPNAAKRCGSMVVWLKTASTAAYLLQKATAYIGAVEVSCSKFVSRTDKLPCFNCGNYKHKQAACKRPRKCAICSEGHSWRECRNQDRPRCSACSGPHPALSAECKLHPDHPIFLRKEEEYNQNPLRTQKEQPLQHQHSQALKAPRAPKPAAQPSSASQGYGTDSTDTTIATQEVEMRDTVETSQC